MRVLAIEASSAEGSVAVVEDDVVQWQESFAAPRGRGSEIFRVLASALHVAGSLDAVVVGTGPGSYNGLRSSIAAGWGIALARGIPLHGASSLLGYDAPEYFVIGDARAGQWFLAKVADGALCGEIELLPPQLAKEALPVNVRIFTASADIDLPQILHQSPHARQLVRASKGPATPIYLKPPHITSPAFLRTKLG